MKNILFIMPDERQVYKDVSVKVGSFHMPSLAFAILGAIAKKNNFNPVILDLTLYDNYTTILKENITKYDPEYIGITGTTAIFFHMINIAKNIKTISPKIKILVGGPHVSSTIENTLEYSCFDYIFVGEAEDSFSEFLTGKDLKKINGLAFRKENGENHISLNQNYIKNLDDYPLPDYSLYDLNLYYVSKLHAKKNPTVWIETSRGCPFDCKICNKIVHGQTFRPKSPERVINEIISLIELGIQEFHVADVGFTSNVKRAEKICDEIIRKKINISWSCTNGIRVDRVNNELLKKMKNAGCYRVSFGIESGNQKILDNFGKKISLEKVEIAIQMAKKAGIEVFGFFMFGFLDDTEHTMLDTIKYAKKLPLDLAKASIIMPFPGSPLHSEYSKLNLIFDPGDYCNYNVYKTPESVYKHPNLDWDTIEKYQKKFYRAFYFNPFYIYKKLIHAIKNKYLFTMIKSALTMKWFNN